MSEAYRQYFENMPCYLSVHDRDLRILEANRRFRRDFGERTGDYCFRAYKGRDEICPECPVEATFKTGESQVSEQVLRPVAGGELPVRVRTTPIFGEDGAIVAVMEMHTDLREARRLQHRIDQTEAKLAQLFEEVPCYIAVQSPDRVILQANRRFRETFGPAEGQACYRVYKHREEPCLFCPCQETFADGKSREHEEVVVSADGRKIDVLCTTAPVRNAAGDIEAVIEMSVDITQLRELQSQLASIGLLVGSISHGIKGLLTGLDGGIYMVNSGFAKDKPERVKQGWEMVQRNVDRIRSMVLDILYYAKDRELQIESIDACRLVTDVVAEQQKRATDLDVELSLDVAPDVGSFPGDAKALRAMLVNILENSLDACRVDVKPVRHWVRVQARRVPDWLELVVEDNGTGMDRETRERIFTLFFSSKGISGTGLGLFISCKIVDKHGGSIQVSSEPGEGTTFRVSLPLEPKPSTQPGRA